MTKNEPNFNRIAKIDLFGGLTVVVLSIICLLLAPSMGFTIFFVLTLLYGVWSTLFGWFSLWVDKNSDNRAE